ncbi:hypothetical protein PHYC_00664 [Phycisphaerales bacterium]|nr:hypothetical protein PHYC_00664 [Phycisphaerales bacterium]
MAACSYMLVLAAAPTPGERLDALAQFAGRLHPLVVHFPIALIILAGALELRRTLRRDAVPSRTAMACLLFGAIGAVVAAATGWLNAAIEINAPDTLVVGSHRWLGIIVAGLSVLALAAAAGARRGASIGFLAAYRTALILTVGVIAVGGHLGNVIVRGDEYVTRPLAAALGRPVRQPAAVATPAGGIDFSRDILPIFDRHCLECHGQAKHRGGLRLDSREGMLEGGDNGPALIPGDAENSPIIRRVLGRDGEDRMPLNRDPISQGQIEALKAWIAAGAPWTTGAIHHDTSKDPAHWSYKPPRRPGPPAINHPALARNDIDRFVLARLDREGLEFAPEAERGVLLRRVSLDLTGLPPSPGDLAAFAVDSSAEAYERAVDRLLASPAYGERWASRWLDLARYADSRGYEKDQTWSMWPYRDWVINALNADMPFDRFTIEQLAGDLLPRATQDQLIATGFHRCSMINEEGGVDPEEARITAVADRVDTTATVWLGTTLACARCHDHKFDPFTTHDYYSLFAFFNNSPGETTQVGDGETRVISETLALPRPDEQELSAREGALNEKLSAAGESDPRTAEWREALKLIQSLQANPPTTQVMRELPTPRATHIFERGNFLTPGEAVAPAVPAALGALPAGPADRLDLARWLVSRDNPLTARVHVNRLWSAYFGRGLVETEEDFGTRGMPPTHPDLLDYLAVEFMEHGWSQKHVHRLIVTSAAYRQSSRVTPDLLEHDPHNTLLARGPRIRLEAEIIRDQALALGGILSTTRGGPSVMPPQPPGIWSHAYSGEQWKNSEGEDSRRRAVYTFWKRASPYPAFVAFDAPQRQVTCTRRSRTNTPLQALTTLNDPVFMECASGLAKRILDQVGMNDDHRIEFAFRACTARTPRAEERARLLALLDQQRSTFAAAPQDAKTLTGEESPERAAWVVVANVLLNLDEVLTKG